MKASTSKYEAPVATAVFSYAGCDSSVPVAIAVAWFLVAIAVARWIDLQVTTRVNTNWCMEEQFA